MNVLDQAIGDNFAIYRGDCVELLRGMPDESIHFSVFSPPFASLYTYSGSPRDMGNCANDDEFFAHFQYLVRELYRVLLPGRLVSFHCMDIPTSKTRNGHIGIRDFSGALIRAFEAEGFYYHSRVTIWKDPVTAMQRTKALGLLWKQIKKDSCMSRMGLPDFVITMRKPGVNPERVSHTPPRTSPSIYGSAMPRLSGWTSARTTRSSIVAPVKRTTSVTSALFSCPSSDAVSSCGATPETLS